MKIVLIAPPIMDYLGANLRLIAQDATKNCPPYGLYLLSNILREQDYEVVILDLIALGTNNIMPFQKILADADLVGITATTLSWPTAHNVVRQLRMMNATVPLVLGGIHPTMFDKYLLETLPVDYVVRGEGEISLLELCRCLECKAELESVPNLSWKTKDGKVVRNKIAPLIKAEELGNYPLPAYDLLPDGVYKGISIESSRGCVFDCAFCSTSYRRSWRGMPSGIFVDRLERILPLVSKTTLGGIHIVDDEFSTNPRRAIGILAEIEKRGLKPALVYDTRANDLLFDGFVERVAPYTNQFLLGAECGYDEGLAKIGKGTTCEKIEAAARKLYENGIAERASFSFILGLPWEERREIEKTIKFATYLFGEYGVRVLLQGYCLIPGSRLWDEERIRRNLSEAMYDDFGFFRNLHFWHLSSRTEPSDAWEIEDMILQLQWLADLAYPNKHMIEHSIPYSLARYFPKRILDSEYDSVSGLGSLREVAKPIS